MAAVHHKKQTNKQTENRIIGNLKAMDYLDLGFLIDREPLSSSSQAALPSGPHLCTGSVRTGRPAAPPELEGPSMRHLLPELNFIPLHPGPCLLPRLALPPLSWAWGSGPSCSRPGILVIETELRARARGQEIRARSLFHE